MNPLPSWPPVPSDVKTKLDEVLYGGIVAKPELRRAYSAFRRLEKVITYYFGYWLRAYQRPS